MTVVVKGFLLWLAEMDMEVTFGYVFCMGCMLM